MNFLSIVEIAIGIIGIILAYFFYVKSKWVKEPSWDIVGSNLIREYTQNVEKLQVTYGGRLVKNLSIAKVVFWNNGTRTVDRNDIVQMNPLRIQTVGDDNNKILDVNVIGTNNESSQFKVSISKDQNSALIDFDYLDRCQGVVIQVVHTGTSCAELNVFGDIKGAPNSKKGQSYVFPRYYRDLYHFMWLAGVLAVVGTFTRYLRSDYEMDWLNMGLGIGLVLFGLIMWLVEHRTVPPRELRNLLK